MEIEGTTFGTITIDGKTYEHDVIIRLSGKVVKRKKKLSKKYYGTSHVLSMRISRRKPRLISRRRAARFCCSPPARRLVRSCSHTASSTMTIARCAT
jgi:hypothetical protein